ncbi:ABC transporter permease [Marilutibacter alkalisoli]|uniref:ABC transporter permease n=1 Tax=Marilutibacter alkalisoli TaxID=2591633 RepID=A0A514BUX6_9GAMM|nr:ABC transporter permease [Lysobacter alkalisoli]QDH71176.1 ABC transporter permease [Lysobacter alkalisoli]
MNAMVESRHSSARAWWLEARCEILRVLRTPAFAVPTLLFAPLFYTLFGVLLAPSGNGSPVSGTAISEYMLATYGVFGVMGVGLFGFGVNVAIDRQRGLLALKRALPMPAGAWLGAKIASAMLFASVCSLLLAVIAATLAGVSLAPMQWLGLFAVNVFGMLPFCALGLWLGTVSSGDASPAVINIVYLPMSFLSGLVVPLAAFPSWLGAVAPLWPSYHLGQIALKVVGRDAGQPLWLHLMVLAGVAVVCLLLARRRLATAA